LTSASSVTAPPPHPLSGVNSVLRGTSEEQEWARKRMDTAREMINAGIIKTPDEFANAGAYELRWDAYRNIKPFVNVIAEALKEKPLPKCVDCGATEKLMILALKIYAGVVFACAVYLWLKGDAP
jgi:hypothetical protein